MTASPTPSWEQSALERATDGNAGVVYALLVVADAVREAGMRVSAAIQREADRNRREAARRAR